MFLRKSSSIFGLVGATRATAGREAVSRLSIHTVAAIVRKADEVVARAISDNDVADQCRELINYINNSHEYIDLQTIEKKMKDFYLTY